VHLLGVRGSTTAPGRSFARYGGHTSCLALRAAADGQPDLVLDAGTGIRDLDALLTGPFRGTVVLTHLHWDHVQGLPFSPAALDPAARLQVIAPAPPGGSVLAALLHGFSPPSFPVAVDRLSAGWTFARAEPEAVVGGWRVRTAVVRHKGGRTIGIRVERDGRSLVYIPDHDLAEPDPDALALARDAHVLLHDAQYRSSEIARFRDYGHSTIESAHRFAAEAGVRHLVLTHHAPGRTDAELDAIRTEWSHVVAGMRTSVARQGARLTL
jgi:phosphoribosyl 1,2-cyclic phosphodiesterase